MSRQVQTFRRNLRLADVCDHQPQDAPCSACPAFGQTRNDWVEAACLPVTRSCAMYHALGTRQSLPFQPIATLWHQTAVMLRWLTVVHLMQMSVPGAACLHVHR
jgi:hypothetical protein